MKTSRLHQRRPKRARGAVAVQVAISLPVLAGVAALTVDVGAMYNAKADLQRCADAAALAAASMLGEYDAEDPPMVLARQEAERYVGENMAFGQALQLATGDVEFGRAVYDPNAGAYTFNPTGTFPDAVRVRVRLTADSPNGPLPLYFARIFGKSVTDVWAEAVAMMVPRDIAIVADLSGSHNDDSIYPHDIHPVWDEFDSGDYGGVDDDPDDQGGEWGPAYACPDGDTDCIYQRGGPAWGFFKVLEWGDEMGEDYDYTTDPGFIRLPEGSNWSTTTLRNYLFAQGYNTTEVNAICSRNYDSSGAYPYRTAVALGLARWNSGISGGLWQDLGIPPSQAGNGNGFVASSELTWVERFGTRSISNSRDIWLDWIDHNPFGSRFGLKAFMHYLQQNRPSHAQTPELANALCQPMQAVKEAVTQLVSTVETLDTNDQMSLEIYGTTAVHEVNLTHDYHLVSDRLNVMQAAHYDGWTNMGGGIQRAIEELDSDRHRPIARKVMFLLTDGMANVTAWGGISESGGRAYALDMAQEAVDDGIMIYAISVGLGADTELMAQIAELGGGEHFYASGSVQSYSAQLTAIFQNLGGARPVELIK